MSTSKNISDCDLKEIVKGAKISKDLEEVEVTSSVSMEREPNFSSWTWMMRALYMGVSRARRFQGEKITSVMTRTSSGS